jgi:DNA polymerase zeta
MYENDDILNDLHNDLTIQPINRYEHSPPRDTHAELEIDALPWQIINRRRLQPRYLHESLRELLHPESIDPDEKLVRSVRELWAEENRRRASKGLPELDTQSRGIDGSGDGIKRLSMSQGDKGWKGGDWDASERFWHSLMDRIQAEKKMKGYEGGLSLDKLGRPSALKGHAEWDRVSHSAVFFRRPQSDH